MPEKELISLDELNASVGKEKELPSLDDLNKGLKKKGPTPPSESSATTSKESESEVPSTSEIELPKISATGDIGVQQGNLTTIASTPSGKKTETVKEVTDRGEKPKFENYLMSGAEKGMRYVESHGKQIAEGVNTALKAEDQLHKPANSISEKILNDTKAGLDLFKGTAETAFGAISFTPAGIGFNAAADLLVPEKAQKWLFSPATSIAEQFGYNPIGNENSLGGKILSTADIVGSLLLMKGAEVGAGKVVGKGEFAPSTGELNQAMYEALSDKIKSKEPLTPEDTKVVSDIVKDATPSKLDEAIANTGKVEPKFSKENEVVDIIGKAKNNEEVKGDIAQLPITKDKFDQVVDVMKEGEHITDAKATQLKLDFDEAQKIKEKMPEEHRSNPQLVNLISERDNLLKAKENTDESFHPAMDEKINAVKEKINNIITKPKEDVKNTTSSDTETAATEQQSTAKSTATAEAALPVSLEEESNNIKSDTNGKVESELLGRIRKAQEDTRSGTGNRPTDRRDVDNKQAYEYAKETGTWIDNIDSLGEPFRGGNEHAIVLNPKEGKVYKSNNLMNTISLENFFEKMRLHNEVFPDTPYKFEGFTGFKDTGAGKPYVEPVYSQDHIKGAENASAEEIIDYMKSNGFEPEGPFTWRKGDIEVSDIRSRNVIKDSKGKIHVIDADFKQLKPKENAVPIRGSEEVPVGEASRNSREVGTRVSEPEKSAGAQKEIKVGEGEVNSELKGKEEISDEDKIIKLKAELAERNKGKLRSGPGLENLDIYTELAYLHIKKGIKTVAEFAKSIGEDVSDAIKKAWEDAHAKHAEERERGFIKTLKDSPQSTEGLKGAAKEMDQYYKVLHNDAVLKRVDKAIDKDPNQARRDVLESKDYSPENSVKAIRLLKHFESIKDYDAVLEMANAYDKQLREAGRFIQAASLWNKLAPETIVRAANKISQGRLKKDLPPEVQKYILKKMGEVDGMKDGMEKDKLTLEVLNYIADQFPPTLGEMFDAYRYQNMLSNPRSHLRNVYSNVFNALITRPLDLSAMAMYDLMRHPFNPAARDVWMSDIPKYYKGVFNSIPNALAGFQEAISSGYISERILDIGSTDSRIEAVRRANMMKYKKAGIPIGQLLTATPRFMEAQDNLFSIMIAQGEKSRLMEHGASESLAAFKSKELAQRYLYRQKLGETTKSDPYLVRALDALGVLAGKGRNLKFIGKLWSYEVPFITTPINVAKAGIERSPLGFLGGSYGKDQVAKATLGTVISGAGALLASQGRTTWALPEDKKERQLFFDSGRKPYSIQIGDKWVPINYFGPFAWALAYPASLRHHEHESKNSLTENEIQHVARASADLMNYTVDQTPMSGIEAFLKAIKGDVDWTNSKALAYSSEQFIPLSGLIKYINTINDPIYRKTSGYIESIEKDIPGLSKDLPAYPGLKGPAHREPINYILPYDVGLSQEEFDLPLTKRRELLQKRQVILDKRR